MKDTKIEGRAADVNKMNIMKKLIAEISEKHGRLDCLINNAGTSSNRPASGLKEDDIRGMITTNFESAFKLCQVYYKSHRKKGGNIINIASIAGLIGGFIMSVYSGTKGAVIQMTKSLAVEWAGSNFRVNAICPGFTETEMTEAIRNNKKAYDSYLQIIPMKRMAKPEEMLGAAVYLASDASSYVTGTTIVVDGGLSRH
jgi:3-oxoacyl-[acyl-carrier protein] reductase